MPRAAVRAERQFSKGSIAPKMDMCGSEERTDRPRKVGWDRERLFERRVHVSGGGVERSGETCGYGQVQKVHLNCAHAILRPIRVVDTIALLVHDPDRWRGADWRHTLLHVSR